MKIVELLEILSEFQSPKYLDSVDKASAAVAESADWDSAEADRAAGQVVRSVAAVVLELSVARQLVEASIAHLELMLAADLVDVDLDLLVQAMH